MEQEKDQKSEVNGAIAAEIRAERGAKRMTVAQLAAKSEIPYGTLNRLLSNERDIRVSQLLQLASALNVSPQTLMDRAVARLGGMEALGFEPTDESQDG